MLIIYFQKKYIYKNNNRILENNNNNKIKNRMGKELNFFKKKRLQVVCIVSFRFPGGAKVMSCIGFVLLKRLVSV